MTRPGDSVMIKMVDDDCDLAPCTHCHREFPRSELRNGVCAECIANDY